MRYVVNHSFEDVRIKLVLFKTFSVHATEKIIKRITAQRIGVEENKKNKKNKRFLFYQ